jgi:oxygen-independent coproporphyrinogen-3 oxidase
LEALDVTQGTACYVHIPFCKAKCPYCDFYSLRLCKDAIMRDYIKACCDALSRQTFWWKTLYIGGGTPSALPPALLGQLLRTAVPRCVPGAEVTMECNPGSVTKALCETLAAGGVNRVSLGVQSVVPRERRALGRTGDPNGIVQSLKWLDEAGIKNVSLDVMLGVPWQTQKSLAETLAFCARHAVHVSAYLLKIEAGTRFAAHPPEGLPDEDALADLYLFCCEWLEAHGFAQYEVSNFAKPGAMSQHNLHYWRCGAYFAVGPAAHGFTQGRRWHYARDLDAFLRGEPPIDDGPGGDFDERAMLALRLREGIWAPSAEMLTRAKQLPGLVVADEKGLRLTREGFLLSNSVIGKLLYG